MTTHGELGRLCETKLKELPPEAQRLRKLLMLEFSHSELNYSTLAETLQKIAKNPDKSCSVKKAVLLFLVVCKHFFVVNTVSHSLTKRTHLLRQFVEVYIRPSFKVFNKRLDKTRFINVTMAQAFLASLDHIFKNVEKKIVAGLCCFL